MKARAAYIRSLTTTGILVASAVILLAVLGTLFAFHGWPGSAGASAVGRVALLPPVSRPSRLLARVPVRPPLRVSAAHGPQPRTAPLSTAGLVKTTGHPVSYGLERTPRFEGRGLSAAPVLDTAPGPRAGRREQPRRGPKRGGGVHRHPLRIPAPPVSSPVALLPIPLPAGAPIVNVTIGQPQVLQVPQPQGLPRPAPVPAALR